MSDVDPDFITREWLIAFEDFLKKDVKPRYGIAKDIEDKQKLITEVQRHSSVNKFSERALKWLQREDGERLRRKRPRFDDRPYEQIPGSIETPDELEDHIPSWFDISTHWFLLRSKTNGMLSNYHRQLSREFDAIIAQDEEYKQKLTSCVELVAKMRERIRDAVFNIGVLERTDTDLQTALNVVYSKKNSLRHEISMISGFSYDRSRFQAEHSLQCKIARMNVFEIAAMHSGRFDTVPSLHTMVKSEPGSMPILPLPQEEEKKKDLVTLQTNAITSAMNYELRVATIQWARFIASFSKSANRGQEVDLRSSHINYLDNVRDYKAAVIEQRLEVVEMVNHIRQRWKITGLIPSTNLYMTTPEESEIIVGEVIKPPLSIEVDDNLIKDYIADEQAKEIKQRNTEILSLSTRSERLEQKITENRKQLAKYSILKGELDKYNDIRFIVRIADHSPHKFNLTYSGLINLIKIKEN